MRDMFPAPNGVERINSFALVSYIRDPLAAFLDRLRQELVPNCFLRAHVTLLPPRPLQSPPEQAWAHIREAASRFEPFTVELTNIEVFPVSDVIYISVGVGSDQLVHMHKALNRGPVESTETFEYHPHITLAQNLTPDQVDELSDVACRRWADFPFDRTCRVEGVTFVQNTRKNVWIDLAQTVLGREVEYADSFVLT